MDKLRALIVDDEFHARENLSMLIEEFCPEIDVLNSAANIVEARKLIIELEPDVIFLDIRMPSGAEGFELLDSIEPKKFQVVFVTAFKEYAIRAFNSHAVHYILKPIDIDDLLNATQKLIEYSKLFKSDENQFDKYLLSIKNLTESLVRNVKMEKLTLYHNHGFKIVSLSEIIRLEADGNCTLLHFEDGTKYLDTKTLKTYEETLPDSEFFRCHKSHIINIQHLKEYVNQEGATAILTENHEVPIARARLSEFLSIAKRI